MNRPKESASRVLEHAEARPKPRKPMKGTGRRIERVPRVRTYREKVFRPSRFPNPSSAPLRNHALIGDLQAVEMARCRLGVLALKDTEARHFLKEREGGT